MVRYSEERKEAVLRKMLPPYNRTIRELAKEEGISEVTLYSWRRQAQGQLSSSNEAEPSRWSSAEKFAVVLESAALNEAELAEYCRQRELSVQDVRAWRAACEQANEWKKERTAPLTMASETARKRIRELECELRLKDKALAEMAALLVLRKCGDAMWREEEP